MKVRSTALFTLLLVGTLLIAACGSSAPPAPPVPTGPAGDAAAGKTKYEGTCIACHGPNATGVPGLGKDLTTSDYAKGLSDGEMIAFLEKGRPSSDPANTTGVDMPPKGGNPALTTQDLADIVAYLRTLEK